MVILFPLWAGIKKLKWLECPNWCWVGSALSFPGRLSSNLWKEAPIGVPGTSIRSVPTKTDEGINTHTHKMLVFFSDASPNKHPNLATAWQRVPSPSLAFPLLGQDQQYFEKFHWFLSVQEVVHPSTPAVLILHGRGLQTCKENYSLICSQKNKILHNLILFLVHWLL